MRNVDNSNQLQCLWITRILIHKKQATYAHFLTCCNNLRLLRFGDFSTLSTALIMEITYLHLLKSSPPEQANDNRKTIRYEPARIAKEDLHEMRIL